MAMHGVRADCRAAPVRPRDWATLGGWNVRALPANDAVRWNVSGFSGGKTMTRRLAPVLVLLMLGAPGCKKLGSALSPTATITYQVAGTTELASVITYSTADGGTAQVSDAALPWSASINANKDDGFLYVSAQNASSTGCITASILEGTRTLYDTESCGGFVIATASGSYK
jgi:hypothetical protein